MDDVTTYDIHVSEAFAQVPQVVVSISHKDSGMTEICIFADSLVLEDELVDQIVVELLCNFVDPPSTWYAIHPVLPFLVRALVLFRNPWWIGLDDIAVKLMHNLTFELGMTGWIWHSGVVEKVFGFLMVRHG